MTPRQRSMITIYLRRLAMLGAIVAAASTAFLFGALYYYSIAQGHGFAAGLEVIKDDDVIWFVATFVAAPAAAFWILRILAEFIDAGLAE